MKYYLVFETTLFNPDKTYYIDNNTKIHMVFSDNKSEAYNLGKEMLLNDHNSSLVSPISIQDYENYLKRKRWTIYFKELHVNDDIIAQKLTEQKEQLLEEMYSPDGIGYTVAKDRFESQ